MNAAGNFQTIQRRKALDEWIADQKRRMSLRFPLIDFDSGYWPIMTRYNVDQRDWHFKKAFADFDGKDISYFEALRCLVAEIVIAGKPKTIDIPVSAYRLLSRATAYSLIDLTLKDLRQLEVDSLHHARRNPASATRVRSTLTFLEKSLLTQLAARGVIPRLGFSVRAEIKAELRKIALAHDRQRKASKSDVLDRKMEAFNEAFNGLVANPLGSDGKPLLSKMDREAICAGVILMCAPSRINEPLCMSIDDLVTIDSYAAATIGKYDALHDAHKLLLMKGSKGAQWSAKPVLSFMIEALDYCMEIVQEQGKRSRMLVEWYLQNPTTLYLPSELEYLRGQPISRQQFAQIMYLTSSVTKSQYMVASSHFFNALKGHALRCSNSEMLASNGNRTRGRMLDLLAWTEVEEFLVKKVSEAMIRCRKVASRTRYQGDLSKMLFLFDHNSNCQPFMPQAITYKAIRLRFKQTESDKKDIRHPTVFQKLNITMPVDGKIQIAEIDTHDPRRWLTTQALIHGENLSNVLINKWANRLSLAQLKNYDKRFPEFKANQAAMPETPETTELTDISNGLAAVEMLEDQFGLSTAIVTAHDAGIAMTSMDAVTQAIENRPVAKSSRGIIIIYPQRFGVCFHQHHEKPCRNYSNDLAASCVTCNESAFIKGHIPTNEETRKIASQLFGSILRHLENLALTHNRGIADDPAALGEHMLTLVEKGLDRVTMVQFATHLIDKVHELKHLIKDRALGNRLHQAFVAREVVRKLDDPNVASGALIKYHNPLQHAEPLLEIAMDAHGGREQVSRDEQSLIAKHPQLAPRALGLTDQRHMIAPDDEKRED